MMRCERCIPGLRTQTLRWQWRPQSAILSGSWTVSALLASTCLALLGGVTPAGGAGQSHLRFLQRSAAIRAGTRAGPPHAASHLNNIEFTLLTKQSELVTLRAGLATVSRVSKLPPPTLLPRVEAAAIDTDPRVAGLFPSTKNSITGKPRRVGDHAWDGRPSTGFLGLNATDNVDQKARWLSALIALRDGVISTESRWLCILDDERDVLNTPRWQQLHAKVVDTVRAYPNSGILLLGSKSSVSSPSEIVCSAHPSPPPRRSSASSVPPIICG